MKILSKIGLTLTAILMVAGVTFVPIAASATGVRDCDSNAVIYCGAYYPGELNGILAHGTGKPNQSSAELTALYAKYGYTPADGVNLKQGTVTKTNQVILNGKVIASNVYTMGRHDIAGSWDVPGINYPLWMRHPGTSFLSSSIPAFILLNSDGSFRMAIIESCGNIVPGTIKQAAPLYLEIRKWNDLNGDNHLQSSEPYLAGWSFHVTGPNTDTTVTTDATGRVFLRGLTPGTYTVDEVAQAGWKTITPAHRVINLTAGLTIYFGNQKVVTPTPTPTPPVTPPETPTVTPPETPTTVITGKGNIPLATTGPVEAAAGAAGLTATGGAAYAWMRSKKALLSALTKIQ